jgi:hypothetical protein
MANEAGDGEEITLFGAADEESRAHTAQNFPGSARIEGDAEGSHFRIFSTSAVQSGSELYGATTWGGGASAPSGFMTTNRSIARDRPARGALGRPRGWGQARSERGLVLA